MSREVKIDGIEYLITKESDTTGMLTETEVTDAIKILKSSRGETSKPRISAEELPQSRRSISAPFGYRLRSNRELIGALKCRPRK